MRHLFSILILLIIFGCKSEKESLRDYPEIQKIFTQAEINDLRLILEFFDNTVCESENVNKRNLAECYEKYFQRLSKEAETGYTDYRISEKEVEELFNQIDNSTFNQIWWIIDNERTENILLNTQGQYFQFLKAFGKTNPKAKNYHEYLIMVGDISPNIVADIFLNYRDYDIDDERIRLLLAIHYLTLNDRYS